MRQECLSNLEEFSPNSAFLRAKHPSKSRTTLQVYVQSRAARNVHTFMYKKLNNSTVYLLLKDKCEG